MQNFNFRQSNLVLSICLILLTGCGANDESKSSTNSRPVNVIKLSNHNNIQPMQFSGVLKSHETAKIAFRVPGTIEKVIVNEGDSVKKGQIIAKLDPHDYQVNVNELSARLREAKAAYKLAKIELGRTRRAAADDAIASVNLDRAVSGHDRAAASVQMLEQSLKKAQDALSYTNLKAPFDGVIGQRFIDEHEQTSPGIPVMSIHQPQSLDAIVDVPEKQISKIKSGMKGQVKWYGQVEPISAINTEIATLPDPLKRTYEVTFKLENIPKYVFPGKAINIMLSQTGDTNTYCIPPSAVKSHNGKNQIVKVINQKATHSFVDVKQVYPDRMCIQGDLKQGDYIVTAGSNLLKEGQKIVSLNNVGA